MYCYRITKYDPQYRNELGAYQRNEWTSISDIGNSFNGIILTPETYLDTENAYIEAIIIFMDYLEVKSMIIRDLEKYEIHEENYLYTKEILKIFNIIQNNEIVDKKTIIAIARLCLRENIWCRLETESMFVHFGYDFYMYLGSKKQSKKIMKKIERLGLFVEEYESPYKF